MAIRVVQAGSACYVHDDRRHVYLDAAGQWRVVPWFFASPQEAFEALRMRNRQDACAAQ